MTARARVRALALAGALLFVAAACGEDDDGDSAVSGTDSSSVETPTSVQEEAVTSMSIDDEDAESAAELGETTTFVDDAGREVEIPTDPKRIVFHTIEHAAHLTSLGYAPLGVAETYGEDPVAILEGIGADLDGLGGPGADLDGLVDLGDGGTANLEAIAAAEPDLIVWSGWDIDRIEMLSEIAPTIGIEERVNGDVDSPDGPRHSKQRTLAGLVGLEEVFEDRLAQYGELVEGIRERHGDLIDDLEWTLISPGDGQFWMYNSPTFAYNAALADVGMTSSAAQAAATEEGIGFDEPFGYARVSAELLPDYVPDLVFKIVGDFDDDPAVEAVLESTPAGQRDQVFGIPVYWTYHLLQAEIDVLEAVDEILSTGDVEDLGEFG